MEITPKIEVKSLKHVFTEPERNVIGGDLARSIAGLRGIEAEFDQVKASYKARTAESEARIDALSTNLMNGFEMRSEKCVVIFRPKDRKKDYYLEADYTDSKTGKKALPPVALTEEMNQQDFDLELIQAEAKFDDREEITLFQPTEKDSGTLIVGRFAGKWFSALRVKIGKLELTERLDGEQRCFKARADAVTHAIKRVSDWAKVNLKEHAKGFEDSFQKCAEAHKDRVE